MNDVKNLFIAWLSAGSPVVAVLTTDTGLTIVSALVLPLVLFAAGKAIDVALQVYFRRRDRERHRVEESL